MNSLMGPIRQASPELETRPCHHCREMPTCMSTATQSLCMAQQHATQGLPADFGTQQRPL